MGLLTTTAALPVLDLAAAAAFYRERVGFDVIHLDEGIAVLRRDGAYINLWQSDDESWRTREDFATRPVRSGAESFLAGTASCRIRVDAVDELFAELQSQSVLHPVSKAGPTDTEWATREFSVLDLDGNLLSFFQLRAQ